MTPSSLVTTTTTLLLWCQLQHLHYSSLGMASSSGLVIASGESDHHHGCDLTCNNQTIEYQYLKCDMCVCKKICGIQQNENVYNCYYQVCSCSGGAPWQSKYLDLSPLILELFISLESWSSWKLSHWVETIMVYSNSCYRCLFMDCLITLSLCFMFLYHGITLQTTTTNIVRKRIP